MKKVVLDTNVFISGIFWAGASREIIDHAREGRVIAYISDKIIQEIREKLLKKFHLSVEEAEFFIIDIQTYTELTEVTTKIKVVEADPTDDKFIECAVSCDADFIISGNHHLLELKNYKGIKIISPRQFLIELM